jgi:hypothetical protein
MTSKRVGLGARQANSATDRLRTRDSMRGKQRNAAQERAEALGCLAKPRDG